MLQAALIINKEQVLIPSPELPFDLKDFNLQTPKPSWKPRGGILGFTDSLPPIEMGHRNQSGAWRGPHGPQRSRCPVFGQVFLSLEKIYIYFKRELLSPIYMLFPPEGWRGMAGEPANCNTGIRQTQCGNSWVISPWILGLYNGNAERPLTTLPGAMGASTITKPTPLKDQKLIDISDRFWGFDHCFSIAKTLLKLETEEVKL